MPRDQQNQVMAFIDKFLNHACDVSVLTNQFMNGYCYYFAVILKQAFSRGTIALAAPFDHFVWIDTDGTAYDIRGIYTPEDEWMYISENWLEKHDLLWPFLHRPDITLNHPNVKLSTHDDQLAWLNSVFLLYEADAKAAELAEE